MSENQLGKLISRHAPSRVFLYYAIFVTLLFSGVSGIIYFGGIVAVQQGKMQFNGDISVLYQIILLILLLAAAILVTAIVQTRGPVFQIFEKGIVAARNGNKTTTLFTEIQDIYLYRSGRGFSNAPNNLAYRISPAQEWQVISARYAGNRKALDHICNQHRELYAQQAWQQLQQGKPVTFRYIDSATAVTKVFGISQQSFLAIQPREIVLHADHLVIEGKAVFYNQLSHFSAGNSFNQLSLYDLEQQPMIKIYFSRILSGHSLVALLDRLINQQPAV